jgi:hypothetical protein
LDVYAIASHWQGKNLQAYDTPRQAHYNLAKKAAAAGDQVMSQCPFTDADASRHVT